MDYNANNQNPNGYELGWEDNISHQDTEFVLLPDGDYDFEVVNFERGTHNGSEKLPPCKKAIVSLRIKNPNGDNVSMKENFFLHSKCMNSLVAFFKSIGQAEDANGQIRMNWNAVIGSTGRCTIGTKLYKDKKYNEIKKFLPKQASSAPAVPSYGTPAATYAPQPAYQPAPAGYAAPQPGYAAPAQPAPAQQQMSFPQVNTATPWDGQQPAQAHYQGYAPGKF